MLVANLSALGLTLASLSDSKHLGKCCNLRPELFVDGRPAVLARWPNIGSDGIWRWVQVDDTDGEGWITYKDVRQHQWRDEKDGWLHGYWQYDWADNYVRIAGVCPPFPAAYHVLVIPCSLPQPCSSLAPRNTTV